MTDCTALARAILAGFDLHYGSFRAGAVAARRHFLAADWARLQALSASRIDLYDRRVAEAVAEIRRRYPEATRDETLWPVVKQAYIPLLYDHRQPECAETFYNSVACRVLDRAYYRNEYIFWRPAVSTEFLVGEQPAWRTYPMGAPGLRSVLRRLLRELEPELPLADEPRDLHRIVRALRERFPGPRERHRAVTIQLLSSMFYRGRAAYAVGRIVDGATLHPFVLCLRHAEPGRSLEVDALLLEPQHLGALFSLARAYFLVDMEVPSAWIGFISRMLPSKRRAELYTAVGLQKQGKTLFYRNLHEHLANSTDPFVVAPGVPGMVMMVFTLPSFPYVFKVIRDHFSPTKDVTAGDVLRQYRLVKHHDRVGRMSDSLEYAQVALPLARFDPELLEKLESACARSVRRDGELLVIEHMYIERRMTPLDVWLRDADEERLRHAIAEFGQAIREMASVNIFPGDMFVKNFGVTRWGRVVFYDFDEVAWLTEINFRRFPPPRDYDDEMAAEPWFPVGPNDVFPEELPQFLFPAGFQRELFLKLHGELADADWWKAQQEKLRAGTMGDVPPYPESVRFRNRFAPGGGKH